MNEVEDAELRALYAAQARLLMFWQQQRAQTGCTRCGHLAGEHVRYSDASPAPCLTTGCECQDYQPH